MHNANAITAKQIMRNSGLPSRASEDVRRSKIDIPRDTQDKSKGFRIHPDFECDTHVLTDFNPHELSLESFIDSEILAYNPLTFSVAIDIVKAHLEIALKAYSVNGIDFDTKKYPIWINSEDEIPDYPEEIALDPNELAKIYYPDTVRSVAYVYYVMMPVLQDFMTEEHYQNLDDVMSVIAFNDVLIDQKRRKIWSYKMYDAQIQKAYQLLDTIEAEYLKKRNLSRNDAIFQKKVINALLINHWASFLSLRSCALVSVPQDPGYDANFYFESPISRDTYLMGLGIFQRLKKLSQHYLFHQQTITKESAFYPIQEYIHFFDNFYKANEPPIQDAIPYSNIEKLETHAVCSLGLNLADCAEREQ